MTWYYALGGQQQGPISETELEALVKAGTIDGNTLVWREGMTTWQPYSQVMAASQGTPPVAGAAAEVATGGLVCSMCGQSFAQDQVLRFGDAWVCAGCKPYYLQRLREGVDAPMPGSIGRYAGFWIRFAAKLLDGLIIGAAVGIPVMILLLLSGRAINPNQVMAAQLVIQLGAIVIQGVYTIFFLTKYSATPGKMICGIKVVMADGRPLSFGRATGRFFAEMVSGFVCYIGYIIVAFDDQKRALHDHMCNTRVVYKK